MTLPVHHTPEVSCPYCGALFNACSNLDGSVASPSAGDFTFCIECHNMLVFTKALCVRKPTRTERSELAGMYRGVRRP